jgi:hypothetical protein
VALRGCLVSTPFAPAPAPPSPPFLEEIFRATLEDCESSLANDWSLSKDRKTIKVHSSLHPSRRGVTCVWRDGRYQAQLHDASCRSGPSAVRSRLSTHKEN